VDFENNSLGILATLTNSDWRRHWHRITSCGMCLYLFIHQS